ncbi:MAG: TetR/AcrR family transcriptional regulator [Archangium sp.]
MAPTRVSTKKVSTLPERLRPRKSPRQKRAVVLVDAILEAGSRVFVERGYENLSMQQVARVAGVSPGSLYQYFPDKGALVAALIDAVSEREVAFHLKMFSELSDQSTLDEVFEKTIRSVLAFQKLEGPLMKRGLEAMPFLGRYPALSERVRATSTFLRGLLEPHAGALPGVDLDLATHVLTNAIHSLTHDGILPRPDTLDDETLTREIMKLVRGYLRT